MVGLKSRGLGSGAGWPWAEHEAVAPSELVDDERTSEFASLLPQTLIDRQGCSTEDGQVEGQASEESKEPEEVPQTTWLSLRDLSISGPNEEVRQRAQQIRAELIRPGQGGAQDFSFSLGPRLPQLVHLGGSCSNQPFSQTP